MNQKVGPDVVDRSRTDRLVHDAQADGRHVKVTAYIEGLPGDENRYARESSIVCRTPGQATEIARVLREANRSES